MIKKSLLIAVFVALFVPTIANARIGETVEQCEERYSKLIPAEPKVEKWHKHPLLFKKEWKSTTQDGMGVICFFAGSETKEPVCIQIGYVVIDHNGKEKNAITTAQAKVLIGKNLPDVAFQFPRPIIQEEPSMALRVEKWNCSKDSWQLQYERAGGMAADNPQAYLARVNGNASGLCYSKLFIISDDYWLIDKRLKDAFDKETGKQEAEEAKDKLKGF